MEPHPHAKVFFDSGFEASSRLLHYTAVRTDNEHSDRVLDTHMHTLTLHCHTHVCMKKESKRRRHLSHSMQLLPKCRDMRLLASSPVVSEQSAGASTAIYRYPQNRQGF